MVCFNPSLLLKFMVIIDNVGSIPVVLQFQKTVAIWNFAQKYSKITTIKHALMKFVF